MAKQTIQAVAQEATIVSNAEDVAADEEKTPKSSDAALVEWVMGRVTRWRTQRDTNHSKQWDMYERLWRAIFSEEEKQHKTERSKIISPALSEAVENGCAEIEEAVFGRGDFFDLWPEARDTQIDRAALDANEVLFKEDIARTDFTGQCSEITTNGAVYGTGIGEIVLEKKIVREISMSVPGIDSATGQPIGTPQPVVTEKEYECPVMKSVNPRNFIIDPAARNIDDALGVAVEEDVGSHIIRQGITAGDYKDVKGLGTGSPDTEIKPDPQGENPWMEDVVPVIRYYGLVPKELLFPKEKTADLFPPETVSDDTKDPLSGEMVEARVVIAHEEHLLKAVENPDMMKDRPVVAYQWDIVPGRFYGRGVCEKGATSQKMLDAELRSRIDAMAYVAAPMMALDASRLPRGFKFEVYPGKTLLLSGDPSTILKPFKFGELDANSAAQVQLLDSLVQRATGSMDATAMARAGVGGEARSGAVSMALAPIVKRNKRTLMRYIDRFLVPAMRKLMARYMQYDAGPGRYTPINFRFNISSTMGIMQREYESANLVQLLNSMQPNTSEQLLILKGLVANSGMQDRDAILAALDTKLQKVQQMEQAPSVDPNAQPAMDPVTLMLAQADAKLELAKKAAETARLRAQARLYDAQAITEQTRPMIEAQKVALKGIYKTPEQQIDEEFDRRMRVAELKLEAAQIASDERISESQERAAKSGTQPKVEIVKVPQPVQVDVPVPMLGAENL